MTLEELMDNPEVRACAVFNGFDMVWSRWKSAPLFCTEDTSYQLKEGASLDDLVEAVRKDVTGNPFPDFLELVPPLEDMVE